MYPPPLPAPHAHTTNEASFNSTKHPKPLILRMYVLVFHFQWSVDTAAHSY